MVHWVRFIIISLIFCPAMIQATQLELNAVPYRLKNDPSQSIAGWCVDLTELPTSIVKLSRVLMLSLADGSGSAANYRIHYSERTSNCQSGAVTMSHLHLELSKQARKFSVHEQSHYIQIQLDNRLHPNVTPADIKLQVSINITEVTAAALADTLEQARIGKLKIEGDKLLADLSQQLQKNQFRCPDFKGKLKVLRRYMNDTGQIKDSLPIAIDHLKGRALLFCGRVQNREDIQEIKGGVLDGSRFVLNSYQYKRKGPAGNFYSNVLGTGREYRVLFSRIPEIGHAYLMWSDDALVPSTGVLVILDQQAFLDTEVTDIQTKKP